MNGRGIAPELVTCNTLLNGWVRAKKMDDAKKVFEIWRRIRSPTINIMIKGYVCVGKVDDGLRLFGEMSAKRPRPSEKTYAAPMPGLCDDAGRKEEARKVLNEMAERRLTPKDKCHLSASRATWMGHWKFTGKWSNSNTWSRCGAILIWCFARELVRRRRV